MRLTVKSHYAVLAMLDLALHGNTEPVTLMKLSRRQSISLAYLEQLFGQLKRNGLVYSVKGPGGGYRLNRPCEEISVALIMDAVNEPIDTMKCGGKKSCHKGNICLSHYVWMDLSLQIHQFLNQINLRELLEREDVQKVFKRQSMNKQNTVNMIV